MAFKIGDRVRRTDSPIGGRWTATVMEVGGPSEMRIRVRIDDPVLEARQYYESGWYAKYFELISSPEELINEDWS